MSGAQLDAAVLTGADLRKANLRSAGFRHAKLDAADFRDARLGGAFLVGPRCGVPICGVHIYDWQGWMARICRMPIWKGSKA